MDYAASTKDRRKVHTELYLRIIKNLPPIPKIMTEVLRLLDTNVATRRSLSELISKDQSLVSKILAISNSAAYGNQKRVSTIDHAILVLGFRELQNVVSAISMIETFRNSTDQYLDVKEFWIHSFATGCIARKLADDYRVAGSGETFIAGFLHDLGISVMHRYFHTDFILISETAENKDVSFNQAEVEVLGLDHQHAAHFLAERWNFPEPICDSLFYHHHPSSAKRNIQLVALVHLADFLAQKLAPKECRWEKGDKLDESVFNILGIKDPVDIDQLIENYRDIYDEALTTSVI